MFEDGIFVSSSVITNNVIFTFIKEYRETTLRSPCGAIDDVITENIFFFIIWDGLFISGFKFNLYLTFWHFQKAAILRSRRNVLPELTPEFEYAIKIAMVICDILSFWTML